MTSAATGHRSPGGREEETVMDNDFFCSHWSQIAWREGGRDGDE